MAADELLQDSLDRWDPEMDELDAIVYSRLGASRGGCAVEVDCSAGNVAVMDRLACVLPCDHPERERAPARRRKGSPGRGGSPPRGHGGRWWLAICLVVAAVFAGRAMFGVSASAPSNSARTALSRSAPATTAIETIRVGQRVVTEPGEGADSETEVDPATWRLLRLRGQTRWDDGTLDDIHAETLQPPEWVAANRAEVGATVPVAPDLEEMGLPEGLRFEVLANEPCPAIADGPGRVVLTTINHLNQDVYELRVCDAAGRVEAVRPTGGHKFYSATRNEWISTRDLRQGERLRGLGGEVAVLGAAAVPGVHRVYNMTVESEHVYRVSHLAVLTHNMCGGSDAKGNFYRYVGEEEARIIQGTGMIPNVDAAGKLKSVYLTDRLYKTAGRAKTHLQLPRKPTHRVEIDPVDVPNRTPFAKVDPSANPKWGLGRGREATTRDAIPVRPGSVFPLNGAQ